MPLQVRCTCGQVYQLPDNMAGKKARCQTCSKIFVVPGPQQNVAQTPQQQSSQPQAPLQQPMQPQAPMQQPMPQQPLQQQYPPYSNPAFPAQGYQKKKTGASKNKIILFGSIGGGALVLVIVLIIAFSGGDKPKDSNDTTDKVAEKSNPADDENVSRQGRIPDGNGAGNSSTKLAKSRNGLCKQIVNMRLNMDVATNASRNGEYYSLCERSPGKTKISLFHRDKPDQITSHEFPGTYSVKAISNDGKYLSLLSSVRPEIYDWTRKEVLRVANASYFTADAKYAIFVDRGFIGAYDLNQDAVVWAVEHGSSDSISDDFTYAIKRGAGEKLFRVDIATRESTELVSVPRDSKIGNAYIFGKGAGYVLVRRNEQLLGYDLVDGNKFLDMELGGRQWLYPSSTSANRTIAAMTIRISSEKGELGIVDLNNQKIIDRIAGTAQNVRVSDDGSTVSYVTSTSLRIWSVDHKLPGKQASASRPYFLDLPADQRIASSLASRFDKFNAESKNTAKPVSREEKWSNSVAKAIKIVGPQTRFGMDDDFMLSAEGNHIASGVWAGSNVGSPVFLWDKRFLPQPVTKKGWLMGIGSKGNLIGIKQWLSRNPKENDRIDVWDFADEKMVFQVTGSGFGNYMVFAPDGKSFLIEKDSQVVQYDISSGKPRASSQDWAKSMNTVSSDFKQLAEVERGSVKFYDITSRKLIREVGLPVPFGRTELREAVSFESNRMLVKRGKSVALVDLANGKELGECDLPNSGVIWRARIARNGQLGIICYLEKNVRHHLLVKLSDQGIEPMGELKIPAEKRCEDFAFSNDGTELFSVAGSVIWWKINK